MKNMTMAILLAFLVVIVIGGIGIFVSYTGTYDTANNYEHNIERLNKASESELSTFTLKVQEQAQIPAMYKDDLKDVLKGYFEGRGKQDDTYVRSFVKQAMPELSSKMYENLMVTIDAGRDAFNNIQKQKIDACSDYGEYRGKFWNKKILAGEFPSKNIDDMCKVISDSRTKTAFKTGEQEVIKLR
ncbi:Phage protein [Yersinia phage fHe-Yen9-04]|uniref:Phage protein n=2 Tax=Eneladusvirus Yen904 TaxID=2560849 RepID=A0A2C9CXQ5_9CAUD|nr:virion structural protein [Yersinia phage fHe-Yen9-04]SOK58617.1 Phage protein [Yersinia phage fHe-Yen9-04]SOK59151.1 Phage protein [Yersinia phage fHe-Yen9-03]VUE36386.1 Phage protein [Yersinia phage fHe-Yen9-04]